MTGGTDNHLLLINLTEVAQGEVSSRDAEQALEQVGITVNKNTVPGERRSPFVTSGIRVGSAAITTRGFSEQKYERIWRIAFDYFKFSCSTGSREHFSQC